MTDETVFTMLFPTNIMPAWPEVEPILRPAVERAGTHTIEDVRKSLLNGSIHLWIQWKAKVEAAAVTEFVPYSTGLRLRVWLGGAADGVEAQWERMADEIMKFAKQNKCIEVETISREGWHRLFPKAKKISCVFRIAV